MGPPVKYKTRGIKNFVFKKSILEARSAHIRTCEQCCVESNRELPDLLGAKRIISVSG